MSFTPIKAEELTVGQPILWTIYDASGEMMLEPGYIPKSAKQIGAFVASGVCRDMEEPLGQAAKTSAPLAQQREEGGLSLDLIKLHIGDSIQLQFQSEVEHTRCVVTLVGYLVDQGVVVTTPVLNGSIMLVREGQIFIVRLFSGKSAYAFTAVTKRVTNNPFPHLHLSYPKEVHGIVVRGNSRSRSNIICHATVEGGTGYACIARDISVGGALIAAKDKIAEIGDHLSLKLRVKLNEYEHLLNMNCQVRSVNPSRPTGDESLTILHGLSFEKVTSQDALVISALLYQNLEKEKDAE